MLTMKSHLSKLARPVGALIFALGLVAGLALAGIAIWGDLEAALFDSSIREEASLDLRCPIMITSRQVVSVTASFNNPTDKPIVLIARAHISLRHVTLMREEDKQISLAPGETQTLAWQVSADDAAYRRLILVKVRSFRYHPLPAREGACGIFVTHLPAPNGDQIVILMFLVSVLGLIAGLGLWLAAGRSTNKAAPDASRAMGLLAGLVLFALLAGLAGWWLAGLAAIAITVLLLGEMLRHLAGH